MCGPHQMPTFEPLASTGTSEKDGILATMMEKDTQAPLGLHMLPFQQVKNPLNTPETVRPPGALSGKGPWHSQGPP